MLNSLVQTDNRQTDADSSRFYLVMSANFRKCAFGAKISKIPYEGGGKLVWNSTDGGANIIAPEAHLRKLADITR